MRMKTAGTTTRTIALAAALAAGWAARAAADDAPGAVTYNKDIAPIMNEKCAGCHQPGQIGPMSLLSYDEARPWAKSIKKTVSEGTMPPWLPDPAYGKFKDDLSLTPEQRAAIISWIDQGAPKGEGTAPKAAIDEKALGWRMGTPDQVFTMLQPFKVGDDVEDHYEHVVIPSNLAEDKWVTGIELKPGAADIVHHILVFIMKPNGESVEKIQAEVRAQHEEEEETWSDSKSGDAKEREERMKRRRESLSERSEGKGREDFLSGGLFGKYGPGTNPEVWPEGYGRLLPKGCNIIFQVHYHKTPGAGTGKSDQSSMAVKYAKGSVANPITTAWIVDPMIHLPAETADIKSVSAFRFIDDGLIHALTPHMHLRGKRFDYEATYPDGTKEILLSVPRWDFNWQFSYVLQEPKSIPKGTTVRAIALFDNTAANPTNPDPKKDVYWGDASTDEMMIGFMDYTYNTKKKFQGQYGLPEGMNAGPFGFGGGGGGARREGADSAGGDSANLKEARRERFQKRREERREKMEERLEKRREENQEAKPPSGSGAN